MGNQEKGSFQGRKRKDRAAAAKQSCGRFYGVGCEELSTSEMKTLLAGSTAPMLRGAKPIRSQGGQCKIFFIPLLRRCLLRYRSTACIVQCLRELRRRRHCLELRSEGEITTPCMIPALRRGKEMIQIRWGCGVCARARVTCTTIFDSLLLSLRFASTKLGGSVLSARELRRSMVFVKAESGPFGRECVETRALLVCAFHYLCATSSSRCLVNLFSLPGGRLLWYLVAIPPLHRARRV